MRYFKIHWLHTFIDEPEYIFSEIDEEGYEVRKVEIFKMVIISYIPILSIQTD